MAGPLYTVDPYSGQTTATHEDGRVVESTPTEAFGFPASVVNGSVIDTAAGTVVLSPGTTGDYLVSALNDGKRIISAPVTMRQANAPSATGLQRTLAGDINVVDAVGSQHTFSITGSIVNHIGKQLAFYTRDDGTEGETRVDSRFANTAALQAELGPAFRLATPGESVERTIRHFLVANYKQELDSIADAGGLTGTSGTDTGSGLVKYLAQMPALSQLQLFSRAVIVPGEKK